MKLCAARYYRPTTSTPLMRRCLIIEDDTENARYVANGLRELGWWVAVCRDGVDAIRRAVEEKWDVIILDRMLPNDVDGLSILRTLRSLGRRTPVVVLSALAATDERVRGLKAGCDDYLTKPFAFSELAARIEAVLRRSQPDEDAREMRVADMRVDLIARSVERAGRHYARSLRAGSQKRKACSCVVRPRSDC